MSDTDIQYNDWGQRLLQRLLSFGDVLREHGLKVHPDQIFDLPLTLSHIDLTQPEDFYHTLKCSLLTQHEYSELFDQLYHSFWGSQLPSEEAKTTTIRPRRKRRPNNQFRISPQKRIQHQRPSFDDPYKRNGKQIQDQQRSRRYNDENDDPNEYEALHPDGSMYSAMELFFQKDFEQFSQDELLMAHQFMASLRWHCGLRPSHRLIRANHGKALDMRHIIRNNLRYGGDILHLTRRARKLKPRPLIILCDISGSMSIHSRILLHFIHTITHGLQYVEAFVFGTHLTRITRQIKKRNIDIALHDVSQTVLDWSGGTRIGESLHQFNYHWSKRVLSHGAVVLIISDGWDRGNIEQLAQEMARLQRGSHQVIWLNPLLGQSNYRPLTQGMKAALPFLDHLLPAQNFQNLLQLGSLLATIEQQRPDRSSKSQQKRVAYWMHRPNYS